jgi:hypothetical protein
VNFRLLSISNRSFCRSSAVSLVRLFPRDSERGHLAVASRPLSRRVLFSAEVGYHFRVRELAMTASLKLIHGGSAAAMANLPGRTA